MAEPKGYWNFLNVYSIVFPTEPGGETEENPNMDFHGDVKEMEISEDELSPRGVLENPASGTESDHSGHSISSSGSSPNEKSLVQRALESNGSQWKSMFGALKKKSVRRFSTIPLLATSYEISRKNLRRKLARIGGTDEKNDVEGFPMTKPSWRNFEYAELAAATDNFNPGETILFNIFYKRKPIPFV